MYASVNMSDFGLPRFTRSSGPSVGRWLPLPQMNRSISFDSTVTPIQQRLRQVQILGMRELKKPLRS